MLWPHGQQSLSLVIKKSTEYSIMTIKILFEITGYCMSYFICTADTENRLLAECEATSILITPNSLFANYKLRIRYSVYGCGNMLWRWYYYRQGRWSWSRVYFITSTTVYAGAAPNITVLISHRDLPHAGTKHFEFNAERAHTTTALTYSCKRAGHTYRYNICMTVPQHRYRVKRHSVAANNTHALKLWMQMFNT